MLAYVQLFRLLGILFLCLLPLLFLMQKPSHMNENGGGGAH
jgi:hypothetical protein